MICCVDGCDRQSCSRKMCSRHYRRWVRHGDPLGGSTFREYSKEWPEILFWSKVDRSGDCWLWTAGTFPDGYGSFRFNGVMTGAHRVCYEWSIGPIPDGMEIDHQCRNKLCVRPQHLRLATHGQNQENVAGAQRNSRSGIRGVYWYPQTNRWRVQVARRTVGYFHTIEEAEAAAIAARNEVFTHNDADR